MQGHSTRPLCKVTFSQSGPTTIRPDLNNFSTWLCRPPRPDLYTIAQAAHFGGVQAFAAGHQTRTIHLTFWLVWGPSSKTSQARSSHLVICITQRSQDLPNFQDILGCSAYQLTKIWIIRSDLGPNFSFRLIIILAHNICIHTITKPKHLTTYIRACDSLRMPYFVM